jgi:hypothetical protein
MTKLHLDVYSPNFTSFKIKLAVGTKKEIEVPYKTQGAWNSYDLDKYIHTGVDLAHLNGLFLLQMCSITMCTLIMFIFERGSIAEVM